MTRATAQPGGPLIQGEHTSNPIVTGCLEQWRDAELAMTVARRCFQTWLQTAAQDPPTNAIMHAYHAHEALHEARHAISGLIETLRVEAVGGGAEACGDATVAPAADQRKPRLGSPVVCA